MDIVAWSGVAGTATDPDDILGQADALRDSRAWAEAATTYAAVLRLRPGTGRSASSTAIA
ncbi:hypothetical protein [Belnapia sp. F-4-1]|uniref:hypothetical protein n=1 Tax=Belnapia sp. F-4-1 TaxID=1545443 RepID=UPI0005BAC268|nr:hypothetical protein [Belnapia sp. F-4-1]